MSTTPDETPDSEVGGTTTRPRQAPARLAQWLGVIVVVFTCIYAIGGPVFGQGVFLGGDHVLSYDPWNEEPNFVERTLLPISDTIDARISRIASERERILDGDFPEWNPLEVGGTDLAAVPDESLGNPLGWPFIVFSPLRSPAATKVLELAVAIIGMVLFARRIGLSRMAGLCGGLVYAFTGFQVVWTNWPHTLVAAWFPLLFWSCERLIQQRRPSDAIWMGLIVASMLSGGFPAVVAYALWALIFYGIARTLVEYWPARSDDGEGSAGEKAIRGTLRPVGRVAWIAAGAMGLAGLLTLWQMLPFATELSQADLSARTGAGRSPLPIRVLATALDPSALGNAAKGHYFGPANPMEALAFVGTAAILVGLAAWLPGPKSARRGVTTIVFVAVAVLTFALFVGGPPLDFFSRLPGVAGSVFGRVRSIWGFFLAVATALGIQRLMEESPQRSAQMKLALRGGGVVIAAVFAIVLTRIGLSANTRNFNREMVPGIMVSAGAAVAMSAVWFARRRGWLVGSAVAPLFLVIAAIEILMFVRPFWPRASDENFLPRLETHDFLAENLGDERYVASGPTLYPGSNTYYGLRSVNGHNMHDSTWAQAIRAVDPDGFASPTYSRPNLDAPEAIGSPILDRLATKYAVLPEGANVFGLTVPAPESTGQTSLSAGDSTMTTFAIGGPVRAVSVNIVSTFVAPEGTTAHVVVELATPGGSATGRRRLRANASAGQFVVPIDGESLSSSDSATLKITFESDAGALEIGTAGDQPAVGFVVSVDDGLRLVEAYPAVIYERLTAMPRFRMASSYEVIADPRDRLDALMDGVNPSVVVLSDQPESGIGSSGGSTADIAGSVLDVRDPDPDRVSVDVDAGSGGYLVVADAIQHSWTVEVDGEPATLVEADHAGAAVAVPGGRHTVELAYAPPSINLARWVSGLTALGLLLGLAGWGVAALVGRRRGASVG